MQKKKENGIEWLEFDLLQDLPITHGVFLRHGGVSPAPFDSLNVSYDVGDDDILVTKNRELIYQQLSSKRPLSPFISLEQTHEDNISIINQKPLEATILPRSDGLCTKLINVPLMVKHADCRAAIFYDPIQHILAIIHAGWKGSVLNIYKKTITLLKEKWAVNPSNLLVGISPSLGPKHAEFINYQKELPEPFWEFQVSDNYFNFWEISKNQLLSEGLLPHHIEIAEIDNYAHPNDYFSFRRDKITGRHATCAFLSKKI